MISNRKLSLIQINGWLNDLRRAGAAFDPEEAGFTNLITGDTPEKRAAVQAEFDGRIAALIAAVEKLDDDFSWFIASI